jgi:hypothetical protein
MNGPFDEEGKADLIKEVWENAIAAGRKVIPQDSVVGASMILAEITLMQAQLDMFYKGELDFNFPNHKDGEDYQPKGMMLHLNTAEEREMMGLAKAGI